MKNILVLTDFSRCANNAVRYAINFCHRYNLNPLFYHSSYQYFFSEIPPNITQRALEVAEKELLGELKESINHQYNYLGLSSDHAKFMVRAGVYLTEKITEIVKNNKIDMIIMGTKGASGIDRVLFGSNAVKIIDQATCPVLTIPLSKKFKPLKKILLFSEFESLKMELNDIIPVAKKLKCVVEICHFNDSYTEPISKVQKIIEDQKEKSKYDDLSLIQEKRNYDRPLVSQIEETVASLKPDLVCMHTLKYNWFEKLLVFSNTKDLVYHSKMSILTFSKKHIHDSILL